MGFLSKCNVDNNEDCVFYIKGLGGCGTLGSCPKQKVEKMLAKNDAVNHPAHYTYGKIECIDFILDKKLDFPLGNAVKYIVRAGHKRSAELCIADKQIEDLEKAKQYIEFEIEHLKGLR